MFSGIVEKLGEVVNKELINNSLFLTIKKPANWEIKPGDSICTNGTCLTVKTVGKDEYITELMPETLNKTYFEDLKEDQVNLEKSLTLNSVLDGHMVTGHIDCMGEVEEVLVKGESKIYKIKFPEKFAKFVAEKASIAVDGISLTVVDVGENFFTISLVDYTLQNTTINKKEVGSKVHLEFDILAKYIEKIICNKQTKQN